MIWKGQFKKLRIAGEQYSYRDYTSTSFLADYNTPVPLVGDCVTDVLGPFFVYEYMYHLQQKLVPKIMNTV